MPRGLNYEIQAIGVAETDNDLARITERMTHAEPAFEQVARILEHGEQRLFDRYHGKYVKTGATRASLTQPTANGAIRAIHGDQLIFGSSIWYARFLRKNKKSAVLVLRPAERKAAVQTIRDYIFGREEP